MHLLQGYRYRLLPSSLKKSSHDKTCVPPRPIHSVSREERGSIVWKRGSRTTCSTKRWTTGGKMHDVLWTSTCNTRLPDRASRTCRHSSQFRQIQIPFRPIGLVIRVHSQWYSPSLISDARVATRGTRDWTTVLYIRVDLSNRRRLNCFDTASLI